jgi:hypothetical protein
MPTAEPVTPSRAAIRLTHLLDAAFDDSTRFPVEVGGLARAVGSELKLGDEISVVQAANLESFEGGLFRVEKGQWALLYNEELSSPGRIRFTQAHELGHFLVHRLQQDEFHCSQSEVGGFQSERKQMEAEADEFASTLLMPVKQFRASVAGQAIDLGVLSVAAKKFGVSLTSAALRWIRATEDSAVLVLSCDGFMKWSVASDKAFKNGAYFKTRGRVVPVPDGSLAADPQKDSSRLGELMPLKTWFENAHGDAVVREMKLQCDNYGYTLSLLHLSAGDTVWAPREWT